MLCALNLANLNGFQWTGCPNVGISYWVDFSRSKVRNDLLTESVLEIIRLEGCR